MGGVPNRAFTRVCCVFLANIDLYLDSYTDSEAVLEHGSGEAPSPARLNGEFEWWCA